MNNKKTEEIIRRFREIRLPVMAETFLGIIEEGKQTELSTITSLIDLQVKRIFREKTIQLIV